MPQIRMWWHKIPMWQLTMRNIISQESNSSEKSWADEVSYFLLKARFSSLPFVSAQRNNPSLKMNLTFFFVVLSQQKRWTIPTFDCTMHDTQWETSSRFTLIFYCCADCKKKKNKINEKLFDRVFRKKFFFSSSRKRLLVLRKPIEACSCVICQKHWKIFYLTMLSALDGIMHALWTKRYGNIKFYFMLFLFARFFFSTIKNRLLCSSILWGVYFRFTLFIIHCSVSIPVILWAWNDRCRYGYGAPSVNIAFDIHSNFFVCDSSNFIWNPTLLFTLVFNLFRNFYCVFHIFRSVRRLRGGPPLTCDSIHFEQLNFHLSFESMQRNNIRPVGSVYWQTQNNTNVHNGFDEICTQTHALHKEIRSYISFLW